MLARNDESASYNRNKNSDMVKNELLNIILITDDEFFFLRIFSSLTYYSVMLIIINQRFTLQTLL